MATHVSRAPVAVLTLLVLAPALAGCANPGVDKTAVTDFLNGDVDARAPGCPFPVADDVEEGIVEADQAVDLAVTPDGRILLAEADRVGVVSTNYTRLEPWPLPRTAAGVRIAAGERLVAVVQSTGEGNATLTTFNATGSEIASRNASIAWDAGLAVHDGRVLVVDDAQPGGTDVALLGPDLAVEERIDLRPETEWVQRIGVCGDRIFWVGGNGPAPGASGTLHVASIEGEDLGTRGEVPYPSRLGVGQDLLFVAGGADEGGEERLTVTTVEGDRLVDLRNVRDREYGTFEVAHSLVYNLRGGVVLVRPLPDFLTRPS